MVCVAIPVICKNLQSVNAVLFRNMTDSICITQTVYCKEFWVLLVSGKKSVVTMVVVW